MAAPALTSYDRVLDGLSPAQLEAVTHGAGPLLIVAGAGTGKTTVLTRRIAHLITSKQARPEEILALTFTDKAAREMAERVDQLIPYGYAETWIGTFHAFGDSVLREGAMEAGLNPQFRVLTRPEQIIFLRERLWKLPLDRFRPLGDPTRNLEALLTLVSRAKDEDVTPQAYQEWAAKRVAEAGDPEKRDEAERHAELAARAAREAARAVPLHPRGRVPGHEPRPARARAAGRKPGRPQHHRRRRRRPGHLPLARRCGREPARLSRAVPERAPGRAHGE